MTCCAANVRFWPIADLNFRERCRLLRSVLAAKRTGVCGAKRSTFNPQQTLAAHRSTREDVDRNGNRKAKQARKIVSESLSHKLTGYRNVMYWLLAVAANSAIIGPSVTSKSK
jgi:hypothetical protein